MTIKEFIEQLQQFPEDMEIKYEYLSARAGASFSAEPKAVQVDGKVLILSGKRVWNA